MVALGCVMVALAALLGESAEIAVRGLGALVLLGSISFRLRRDRRIARAPWLFIGAAGVLALVSAFVRLAHGAAIGQDNPFPSYAEIPGYAGYLMIVLSAHSFWAHRSSRRDVEATLDGMLVAAAAAVVVFTAVLSNYLRDDSFTIWARGGNVLYSLLTIALIGHVARLAVGPGVRNMAWRNLAIGSVTLMTNDLMLLLDTTGSSWALGVARSSSTLTFVFVAASILHPEVHGLTSPPEYVEPRLSATRIVMLGTALLTLPVALLASLVNSTEPDLPVLVVGSVVLAGLSLTRISLLFRSKERTADLEASLTSSGRELLDAHTEGEVAAAVAKTIQLVVGADTRFVARINGGPGRNHLVSRFEALKGAEATLIDDDNADAFTGAAIERSSDDYRIVTLELGDDAAFGDIAVEIPHAAEGALGLALQTMSAQITQALASLRLAESRFERRAERRLKALVEQSADLVCVIDQDKVVYVSPNALNVLGHEAEVLIGGNPLDLVHPDDREAVSEVISNPSKPSQTPVVVESRGLTAAGEYRWFSLTARDFRDDTTVAGVVLTARDITVERDAKAGLERSEQWFRGLVQHSSDVIAVIDRDGVFTYASPAAPVLTGLQPEELKGRKFIDLLPEESTQTVDQVRNMIESDRPGVSNLELVIARPDGTHRTAEVTITDLRNDASVGGLVLNIRDVTERKRLEEDLRYQAMHDELTGLASRAQFTTQVSNALTSDTRDGSMVGVLFIDIDDFKNINDSLGHGQGDEVLIEIGARLLGRLRGHDKAARFGGDEFAVLLADPKSHADVVKVADRIVEELSQPMRLMGQEVQLSVSVGIAIDSDGTQTPANLLQAADVAMYAAKAKGKGRWTLFEETMAEETLERFEIANALGSAIENDELLVYYQPIVDLATQKTMGVEALVRWIHPERGFISPARFIPIAERNGLIIPLGADVLRTAVSQVAQWRSDGHDIYASVNLSAVQLAQDGIVSEILEIVDGANIDRGAVVLELTESALIEDSDLVIERIDNLRDAGLKVAIDDFGTGYATLKYVDQFSADILKIDKSFVDKLEDHEKSTIVTTVLNIAHSKGAKAVAEGVESEIQRERLLALGCDLGQGYHFARPAPADEVAAALKAQLSAAW